MRCVCALREFDPTGRDEGTTTMRMVGTFSPPRFENYFAELAEEIANRGGEHL